MLYRAAWDKTIWEQEQKLRLYFSIYRKPVVRFVLACLIYVALLIGVIALAFVKLQTAILLPACLLAVTATASLILWSLVSETVPMQRVDRLVKISTRQKELRTLIEKSLRPYSEDKRSFFELQVHKLLLQVANSASGILTREAGATCAVAIKLLWWGPVSTTIHSFVRDSDSKALRSSSPDDFSVTSNTAFEEIIYKGNADEHFVCDDLISLSYEGKYKNKNERWPDFYNSTAVAAIRHDNRIVGFFCVDSLEGKLSGDRIAALIDQFCEHVGASFELLLAGQHAPASAQYDCRIGFSLSDGILAPASLGSQLHFQEAVEHLQRSIQAMSYGDPGLGDLTRHRRDLIEKDRSFEAAKQLAAGSTTMFPEPRELSRASPIQGDDMKRDTSRSTLQPGFTDPAFDDLLDEETRAVLAKIKARTQEEVTAGLIKTGVITSDGRRLTKKYGGS